MGKKLDNCNRMINKIYLKKPLFEVSSSTSLNPAPNQVQSDISQMLQISICGRDGVSMLFFLGVSLICFYEH